MRKTLGVDTTTSTMAGNLLEAQQYLHRMGRPLHRRETSLIGCWKDGTSEAERISQPKRRTRQRLKASDEGRRRISRTSVDIRIGSSEDLPAATADESGLRASDLRLNTNRMSVRFRESGARMI